MPVVISKEFFYNRITSDLGCDLVHHWDKNCRTAFLGLGPQLAWGTTKFFLPIYLLKSIYDYKQKRKNLVRRFFQRHIRTAAYGFFMGSNLILAMCCLNKLFGRLYYYHMFLVSGMFSGTAILVETDENRTLNTLVFFNSFIETILNKLKLSIKQETLLFMAVSGILMQLFETRKEEIDFIYWWFYTPPLKKMTCDDDEYKCAHKGKCEIFFFTGFLKYFGIGVGINLTKRLLGKINVMIKSPKSILEIVFHKSNVYFGLFIGIYVGLYRVLTCFFTKTKIVGRKWHGLISGTLSGIMYSIYPSTQITIIAITTFLQIIYDKLCKQYKITNHFYQKILLFQLTHAYNLHNKFFYQSTCSPYYNKMIDACTNNVAKQLYDTLTIKYFS